MGPAVLTGPNSLPGGISGPRNFVLPVPTPVEAFDTGWSKLSGGGTVTDNDNTHFKSGTGALKMSCDGTSNLFAQKTISLNFTTLAPQSFSFWIYCDFTADWTTTQVTGSFFFSSDGFSTSDQTSSTYFSLSQGWQLVTFSRADFASAAGGWTATMTAMRCKVNAVAGQTVTLWIDSMMINYGLYDGAKPFILIDFDDAFDSVYTNAYPILSAAGMVANLYIVSSFLDDASSHITTAHAQALYDAGWDICNHTDLHNNLKAETAGNITTSLTNCQTVLLANGWTRAYKHGAWPNGGTGVNTDTGAANAGMTTMRGTQNCLNVPWVIDNPYKLACHSVDGTTETPTTLLGLVDRAVAGGYNLRFLFHNIIAGAPSVASEYKTADFQTFITGLGSKAIRNTRWSSFYSYVT